MREDYLNSENNSSSKDKEFENILRPKSFKDFYGQEQILNNIKIFVKAAKNRNEPLDHVILHGPPGLGKTTISSKSNTPSEVTGNRKVINKIKKQKGIVKIGVVGKYTNLKDSYKSLIEALNHGGIENNVKVKINWINA